MAVTAQILRPDQHVLVSLDGLVNTVNNKTSIQVPLFIQGELLQG
jgi:hypothetical protein